ncbi:bifunctional DNA-formamidopyrimidine glycosylase/DNA-(apurinic or apyrimidinic site) lyase [Lentisalinibacter salinarum]|uniref:bifunctional DNA-formamidopyrimidine glycosylase/DNA-(apurinic or apyrimidinic site) lyase n=1 Tax=Lentisalinibacter salinarum TaxID=2992239 RepID=UPI003870B336
MPELPEVETTRRGVEPHLAGRRIAALSVRDPRLRWPVAPDIAARAQGQRITAVDRRAKYLLIRLESGSLMLHLGMSGSLRIVPAEAPLRTHDHLELVLDDGHRLRFHDPRRFGSLHWVPHGTQHPLLARLGPEPLEEAFDGAWLRRAFAGRRAAVKTALMDARVVVGVGNIYASEALYRAGIHPSRPAGRISRQRLDRLADAVKSVLSEAIAAGGTTLRDFYGGDGEPGYFRQSLSVYGRAGEPCPDCGEPVRQRVIGQRSSYYCPRCQR